MGDIDAIEMMQLASVLRNKLKERRKIKNKYNVLKRMRGFIERHPNFESELRDLLYSLNNTKQKHENLSYRAKSLDGQELINEFSKDGDDLDKRSKLEEMKNKLEMVNAS